MSEKTITLLAYQSRSSKADEILMECLNKYNLRHSIIKDLDPFYKKDTVVIYEILKESRDDDNKKQEL